MLSMLDCLGQDLREGRSAAVARSTPLCPAGHLPLKGEIGKTRKPCLTGTAEGGRDGPPFNLPPLREMPGRAEGGSRRRQEW
nr:hypothetical protein SHINE37_44296 [Rhizobiaceae bacterium]